MRHVLGAADSVTREEYLAAKGAARILLEDGYALLNTTIMYLYIQKTGQNDGLIAFIERTNANIACRFSAEQAN